MKGELSTTEMYLAVILHETVAPWMETGKWMGWYDWSRVK